MNTFSKLWGVFTPAEAKAKIAEQVAKKISKSPRILKSRHCRSLAAISLKSS